MGLVKKVPLVGAKQMQGYMARVGGALPGILRDTLYENGVEIMADSQRIVPHAEGTLAGSGVVKPPEVAIGGTVVELGYGGSASAYAEKQHEDLSLSHPDPTNPNSRPTGEPKYLERPARARVPILRDDLKRRVEQELKP